MAENPVYIPPGWKTRLTAGKAAYLAKLAAEAEWPPPEPIPEEFAIPLIACDIAFSGKQLREMCDERGFSHVGHKKILCARLMSRHVAEVLDAVEIYMEEARKLVEQEGVQ